MDFQFISIAEASVESLLRGINKVVINPIIIFLFAVALVYFVYGLLQYLSSPDSEEVRKKSKSHMIWGVVGLFIMVAVFGIMRLILSTVGENKIKINDAGDYVVDGSNLVNRATKDPTVVAPFKQNDLSTNVNAPDLPAATFTTSPFATYKQDALCWQKSVPGKPTNTEYGAINSAKTESRKQYLESNGVSSTDKTKANYPLAFGTKVLYNKTNKMYYAWIDARAPIGVGTEANCKLEMLTPAPNIPASVFTLGEQNLSTTTANSTITDYTVSPFTRIYTPNPLCWRKEIMGVGTTEYQALQQVKSKARNDYISENGLVDADVKPNLPNTYGVVTAYDKVTKNFYAWWDARGPILGGKDSDCNLSEFARLNLDYSVMSKRKIKTKNKQWISS